MSIEAQPQQDIHETGNPVDYRLMERLSDQERAALQAVMDTRPSKSVLLPEDMQERMKTLPTNDEGERTEAGEVIAIRKYASEKLRQDDARKAESATDAPLDTHQTAEPAPKKRRAAHTAGPSPYATGDGMIQAAEPRVIEKGGTITSGSGATGKSRRATREATSLTSPDSYATEYEQRVYSNGSKHFWTTDKNGKKHHISASSILADFGHAGDFQGKAPKAKTEPQVTTTPNSVNSLERDDEVLEMPASYNDKKAWNKKTPAEKRKTIELAEALAAEDATLAAAENTESAPVSKREAVKNLGHLAAAKAMVGLNKTLEFYGNKEKGKRRIVGSVLGALAMVGVGVVVHELTKHGASVPTPGGASNGNTLAELAQNKPHDVAGKQAALHEIAAANRATEKAHQHITEALPTYNARTGAGTVDHLVADQVSHLGRHMTEAQHHALTQQTLHLNGLSWEDARHLPVGYHVHMLSQAQIEEILKNS